VMGLLLGLLVTTPGAWPARPTFQGRGRCLSTPDPVRNPVARSSSNKKTRS
jgi:hypothetical protein